MVSLGPDHFPGPSTRRQDTWAPWPLTELQRFVLGMSGKDPDICFLCNTVPRFLNSWGGVYTGNYFIFCLLVFSFVFLLFCFLAHLEAFCCPPTSVVATENAVFSAGDNIGPCTCRANIALLGIAGVLSLC